jgi:hypothetical protein
MRKTVALPTMASYIIQELRLSTDERKQVRQSTNC